MSYMLSFFISIVVLSKSCLFDLRNIEKLGKEFNKFENVRYVCPVDTSFLSFWREFVFAAKGRKYDKMRRMALDSIEVNGESISFEGFLKNDFKRIFDDTLFSKLYNLKNVDFLDDKMDIGYSPAKRKDAKGMEERLKIVNVTKSDLYPNVVIAIFEFLCLKDGYRFYAYSTIGE